MDRVRQCRSQSTFKAAEAHFKKVKDFHGKVETEIFVFFLHFSSKSRTNLKSKVNFFIVVFFSKDFVNVSHKCVEVSLKRFAIRKIFNVLFFSKSLQMCGISESPERKKVSNTRSFFPF